MMSTTESLSLRLVQPGDRRVDALLSEYSAFMAELYPEDLDDPSMDMALAPDDRLYAASLDADVVGCGVLRPVGSDALEMKRLFVRPTSRERGLGGWIVRQLEQEAVTQGFECIQLITGRVSPTPFACMSVSDIARARLLRPIVRIR